MHMHINLLLYEADNGENIHYLLSMNSILNILFITDVEATYFCLANMDFVTAYQTAQNYILYYEVYRKSFFNN